MIYTRVLSLTLNGLAIFDTYLLASLTLMLPCTRRSL
jgi:hypothetical protein